jgi:hypothetical protein
MITVQALTRIFFVAERTLVRVVRAVDVAVAVEVGWETG